MALAGYAVGAAHGFVLTPLGVPAAPSRRSTRRSTRRARPGWLGEDIRGSGFSLRRRRSLEGAGSYVVGEETALLACLEGLRGTVSARPPFPAAARPLRHADGRQQHRDAGQHPVHRAPRRRGLRELSARARRPGIEARLLQRALRAPGRLRGPLRHDDARAVRGRSPAGCATAARSRRCRSAARSAGSCRRRCSTRRSTSTTLAAERLHGRPRRHRRLRRAHRHARARAPPAALRRARELRQVLPVPDRAAPRARRCSPPTRRSTAPASSSCSRRSSSAACARTAAACRRRCAACSPTSPTSWGWPDARSRSTAPRSRSTPGTTMLEAIRRGRRATCRRSASTSARRRSAPAASAWSASRARAGRSRRARRPCRDGMEIDTHDATARRVATRDRRARALRAARARRRRTPSSPQVAAPARRRRRAALARRHAPASTTTPPPLPRLPARAVHLLRALRARLRRGPGRVRADRDRPRLRR